MEGVYLLKKIKDRCKIDGDCWVWNQCLNNKGQPQMSHDGKGGLMVRRLSVTASGRNIPRGYVVTATDECGNHLCCNPAHIKVTTRGAVIKHAYKSGARNVAQEVEARRKKAIAQGWAKLDEKKVADIRAMLARGIPQSHIAADFGVHPKTIYTIYHGLHWHKPLAASVFEWRPPA